jgi:HlyD family secretion protein
MADPSDIDTFLGTKAKPWWSRHRKALALTAAALVLVLVLSQCLHAKPATRYAVAPVEQRALSVIVSATGKLAPTNQVQVGSELSGLVTRVEADVNDRVRAGQTLALVDPSRFQDTVEQSRAALNADIAAVAQAKATLDQAAAQLTRLEEVSRLSGGRVPAKVEMDQAARDRDRAAANLAAAQANVASARASLSSNVTQLTKTVIRSPVTGVVLARQIEPGQTVAASFNTPTLFVIAEDLSTMKLQVAIDEADVGAVREGQSASFTVDAFPGKTFPAVLKRIDVGSNLSAQTSSTAQSAVTGQVVSYGATLSVANPGLQLRPGMTATADIVTVARDKVLLVPNAALRFKPAGAEVAVGSIGPSPFGARPRPVKDDKAVVRGATRTVYVLDAAGRPRPVAITTGVTNGAVTEVLGGALRPGMSVIPGVLATAAPEQAKRPASEGGPRDGR